MSNHHTPFLDPQASPYVLDIVAARSLGITHAWPRALREAEALWVVVQDDFPLAWAATRAEAEALVPGRT